MWPPALARVVATHGAARVWAVGIDVLGFPPTWDATGREMKAVIDVLKTR